MKTSRILGIAVIALVALSCWLATHLFDSAISQLFELSEIVRYAIAFMAGAISYLAARAGFLSKKIEKGDDHK